MGLDTVELVMAFEEEFGIDIPDQEAERMVYVRDVVRFFKERMDVTPPEDCLTKRVFYKLRRALIENYGLQRHQIQRNTVLSDLMPLKQIEDGWPYLEMFLKLETPSFKRSCEIFGFEHNVQVLTIEEIIYRLLAINQGKLGYYDKDEQEIFRRVVDVTVRQLNVDRDQVHMDVTFTRDLGAE